MHVPAHAGTHAHMPAYVHAPAHAHVPARMCVHWYVHERRQHVCACACMCTHECTCVCQHTRVHTGTKFSVSRTQPPALPSAAADVTAPVSPPVKGGAPTRPAGTGVLWTGSCGGQPPGVCAGCGEGRLRPGPELTLCTSHAGHQLRSGPRGAAGAPGPHGGGRRTRTGRRLCPESPLARPRGGSASDSSNRPRARPPLTLCRRNACSSHAMTAGGLQTPPARCSGAASGQPRTQASSSSTRGRPERFPRDAGGSRHFPRTVPGHSDVSCPRQVPARATPQASPRCRPLLPPPARASAPRVSPARAALAQNF